jgi:WD40 repeat protein
MAPADEVGLTFDNPFVSSLAWSPEGERLAYSVWSYSNIPSPKADGLWLLTVAEGTQIKLLDNRYMDRETSDVSHVRFPQPLAWSPDGQALLVRMGYWEHSDMLWMEPLVSTADDSNLHDPEGLWVDASWSVDGRAVWLSGGDRGGFVSDLGQADRHQAGVTLLLDGDVEALDFYRAQEVPEGLVFLGLDVMGDGARLYLGSESDSGFTYEAIGPADPLCNGGPVWDIVWDPTGQWAAVTCQEEVKLISLDGGSQEDLTPFLQPLDWPTERSVLFWGS